MKIQKRHWFVIFSFFLLILGMEAYQYTKTVKEEIVNAVTVGTPNPGHSLAQLECSADSLCVDVANKRIGIGTANPGSNLEVNAGSATLSKNLLTVKGGGTSGAYGFEVQANNGESIFKTDNFTYNVTIATMAGKVGIGTASPNNKLEVSAIGAGARFSYSPEPQNYYLDLTIDTAGSDHVGYRWQTHQYSLGNRDVLFFSDTGNVGIGTTSPSYTLTVAGTAWVTSGSWSGSDIRWKKNIETMSQSSSLDKVMALNPVTYQWKTDEYPQMKFSSGTQLGFIAQDVEKIIPEVVTTNNEGYKGISYEKIVPVLTSAIQEQEKKIDALSSQNQSLKALVCLDHPLAEVCK